MTEPSQTGIRKCMQCGWLFVSLDIERIRRCQDCKQGDSDYTPRQVRDPQSGTGRAQGLLKDLF